MRRRYRLGPTILRLGLAALARADLHRLALPHLRALRDRTGETATVTVLSDGERVYVDQVESSQPVRQIIEAGTRAPLYLGASSKAILAHLSADRQAAIFEHAAHERRVDGVLVDVAALTAELCTIRERGFAISRGERIAGAASVAAPIFGHGGDVIAAATGFGAASNVIVFPDAPLRLVPRSDRPELLFYSVLGVKVIPPTPRGLGEAVPLPGRPSAR